MRRKSVVSRPVRPPVLTFGGASGYVSRRASLPSVFNEVDPVGHRTSEVWLSGDQAREALPRWSLISGC